MMKGISLNCKGACYGERHLFKTNRKGHSELVIMTMLMNWVCMFVLFVSFGIYDKKIILGMHEVKMYSLEFHCLCGSIDL